MSKKHLLISTSIAAALFATGALADSNTVDLTQTGDAQVATITQGGGGNYVGYGAQAFIQQNGGLGGGNSLQVNQNGYNNSVGVAKQGIQSGYQNSAVLQQDGNNSRIELQQYGDSNGRDALTTTPPLRTGSWIWPGHNLNKAVQDASANGSVTDIFQNGNNNWFDISQGGTANTIGVVQNGGWGEAYAKQTSSASYSSISISQTSPNTVDPNYASATQDGLYGYGVGNSIAIGQTGTYLQASVSQTGDHNRITSSQTGLDNRLGYDNGPNYGVETIFTQVGSYNALDNYQSGSHNAIGGGQSGGNNYIYNSQSDSNNYALVTQTGYNLTSYGVQSGNNNKATVTQTGNLNVSNYNQAGNNNVATITQH